QLRANVREMEKLCSRVRPKDASALEALVQPVRDRASAAVHDFLLLHSRPVSQPPSPAGTSQQIQLQLPEIPADQSAAESWDNLEEVSRTLSSRLQVLGFRIIITKIKAGGR
ncbi:unnamed protein product, partial [Tetraodon nigroviridis]